MTNDAPSTVVVCVVGDTPEAFHDPGQQWGAVELAKNEMGVRVAQRNRQTAASVSLRNWDCRRLS